MKRAQLAICDSNRTYCERLSEYLRNSLNFSFEIISFTEGEKLLAHLENAEVSLLIISHRHYEDLGKEIPQERTKNIIVRYFPGAVTGKYVRITIGLPEEMEILYSAVKEYLS